jgi:1,4-dihydroxy-2-naphthoate octaprenyltransferase
MPLVLGLPAVGYGFAHWDRALDLRAPAAFLAVLGAWWFLSAGTLWLNAALDRDEGEVLMGPTSAVPAGIDRFGYGALALAVALGAAAGVVPLACVAACAVLAVLYSHPATAWKGHPVLGPLTNVVGYGLLSPIAGWSVVRAEATPRTLAALVLAAAWVAATYFGAQAFQGDEDRRRGYRTLVVSAGPTGAIGAARGLYATSFLGLAALAALGWFPRAVLLASPAWLALDRHLVAWGREPSPGASGGREMLRRATVLAVAVLVTVTAEHLWNALRGRPPAGLGTAWP